MALTSAVKRMAEAGLLRFGAAALGRHRVSGRTVVLAYHNVVTDGSAMLGDTSLHIPLSVFRRHLDAIEEHAEVVPLDAVARSSEVTHPRVVLTFDDAYRGTLRNGLPELAHRNLSATIFVPPAFVPGRSFWWDDVARCGGLAAADRATALDQLRGRDEEVRHWFANRLGRLPEAADDLQCASIEELTRAVAAGPVILGSHTWSHPNLARATTKELADELSRPLAWLREHFPAHFRPAISYPYGLRSAAVETAARDAGYTMGFLVEGGWLPSRSDNLFALPRLNVPAGLSADGLGLRLSGFFA